MLRPFGDDDFSALAALAGTRRVADTMISVPHPYSREDAKEDIARYHREWASGSAVNLAIVLPDQQLIGYIAVKHNDPEHKEGELGFWVAEPAAGKGYATEAALAIRDYAFDELGLNRICAYQRSLSASRVS